MTDTTPPQAVDYSGRPLTEGDTVAFISTDPVCPHQGRIRVVGPHNTTSGFPPEPAPPVSAACQTARSAGCRGHPPWRHPPTFPRPRSATAPRERDARPTGPLPGGRSHTGRKPGSMLPAVAGMVPSSGAVGTAPRDFGDEPRPVKGRGSLVFSIDNPTRIP